MQNDCVEIFMNYFAKNDILGALQSILQYPGIPFDSLNSNYKPVLNATENYLHSSILASSPEDPEPNLHVLSTLLTNICLQKVIEVFANQLPYSQQVLHHLKFEHNILNFLSMPEEIFKKTIQNNFISNYLNNIRFGTPISEENIQKTLSDAPEHFRPLLTSQIALSQALSRVKTQRSDLATFVSVSIPWYPYRYPKGVSPHFPDTEGSFVIFLEPMETDYISLIKAVDKKPAIFVFETQYAFIQMLQFPVIESILKDPKNLIYILEIYPDEQLPFQKSYQSQWKNLSPIYYGNKPVLQECSKLFIEVLEQYLSQERVTIKNDSDYSNWLYAISKRIIFKLYEHQLGINRSPAFTAWMKDLEWYSKHKKLPSNDVPLGSELQGYYAQKLQELSKLRAPREIGNRKKIKIAHIVPQVIAVGHAPTNLLNTLLTEYNKEKYEIILICSERLSWHLLEYPFTSRTSTSSRVRGTKILHQFQSEGIVVYVADIEHTFEETAVMISKILTMHEIDIAVFHGPDTINQMCAQVTDVPIRIMFEHGSQPEYPGFDLAIVSTQEATVIYRDLFNRLNTKPVALPFSADLRKTWTNPAPTRKELELPLEGFFMTTISNNLDARLGSDMCLAIAEILQRCPNAYYTPIGKIFNTESFMSFFKEKGVADRVIFLGPQPNPSNIARTMNLYLNEFPFGSCLGILDAMASGCPVISMYDEKGPQQSRYGGIFFGLERAITSNLRNDYVELACRLIQDEEVYKEWSGHAIRQYDKQLNTKKYVEDFERILEDAIKNKKNGI